MANPNFSGFPPFNAPPPKKRELPSQLKAILGLKVVGCLFVIAGSLLTLLGLSDKHVPSDIAHNIARLTSLGTGAALLELLAVAGIWSFKRWGVYMMAGFTMLGLVFNLKLGGVGFTTIVNVVMTAVAGIAIAVRWNDFE